MSFRWALVGGSLLAHGVLVLALGEIRPPAALASTAIEVVESVKPAPPEPAHVEPPSPEPAARAQADKPKARAAKPVEAPPPEPSPAAASPLANLPDFGLELSGGSGGNGLAIPQGQAPARRERASSVQKTLEKAAPSSKAIDTCEDGPAKPKLLNLPQPTYTDAARAAGVEGKVRVQLTVDETGKVVDAKALSSLGHGLDEAALAAARAATFEPAIRCGKPSRSTFTIAIRFAAS